MTALLASFSELRERVVRCRAGPTDKEEVRDAIDTLLQEVRSTCTTQRCLPIQEAVMCQESARMAWHLTCTWGAQEPMTDVVAAFRHLTVLIYLIGSNYFAAPKIRSAYFAAHGSETEKCVIMCLRTAKNLSAHDYNADAKSLLGFADVISQCGAPFSPKGARLAMETALARLRVLWRMAEFEEALRVSAALSAETQRYPLYREELLHAITTIGEDSPGKVHDEVYLRSLLTISLGMQTAAPIVVHKHRALLGCTYLQMASSFLRSEDYEEAFAAAQTAYEELQSLEPLVVQLAALSYQRKETSAVELFCTLLQRADMVLEDAFSMASLLLDTNKGAYEAVKKHLKEANGLEQKASKLFQFLLVCLMVRVHTDVSICDACTELESVSSESTYCRFYFTMMWDVGNEAALSFRTRHKALLTGLTWEGCSSTSELRGMWMDLAELSCHQFSTVSDDGTFLRDCLAAWDRLPDEEDGGVHATLYLCQIHYLLEDTVQGAAYLRLLLRSPPEVCSCVSALLVSTFQKAQNVPVAAAVARAFLDGSGSCTTEERLEFLRVCVLGVLVDVDVDLEWVKTLLAQVVPALQKAADAAIETDFLWWCQSLWYLSEVILNSDPSQAVQHSVAACDLFSIRCDCTTPEARDILCNRAIFVLQHEFDLYVCGASALSPEAVSSQMNSLSEISNPSAAAVRRILELSKAEVRLRTDPLSFIHHEVEFIDEFSKIVTSSELEALATAVTREARTHEPLHVLAVRLQLAAIASYHSAATESQACLTQTLVMYFKAYEMATSEEMKVTVCNALSDAVASLMTPTLRGALPEHVETLMTFFSIETWNAAVHSNRLRDKDKCCTWRGFSQRLSSTLPPGNDTRAVIESFLRDMPVL